MLDQVLENSPAMAPAPIHDPGSSNKSKITHSDIKDNFNIDDELKESFLKAIQRQELRRKMKEDNFNKLKQNIV
jgi:hypothetical protein